MLMGQDAIGQLIGKMQAEAKATARAKPNTGRREIACAGFWVAAMALAQPGSGLMLPPPPFMCGCHSWSLRIPNIPKSNLLARHCGIQPRILVFQHRDALWFCGEPFFDEMGSIPPRAGNRRSHLSSRTIRLAGNSGSAGLPAPHSVNRLLDLSRDLPRHKVQVLALISAVLTGCFGYFSRVASR